MMIDHLQQQQCAENSNTACNVTTTPNEISLSLLR